ncbi:MAG: hypothetical protein QXL96_08825 [Ignisphaera sp.]
MSMLSQSIRRILTSTLLRKIVHLIFSLILLIPFTHFYRETAFKIWSSSPDPTLIFLTVLLFGAAILNSFQIRLPNLREKFFKTSADIRKRIREGLEVNSRGKPYGELLEGFLTSIAKYEEKFLEFISMVERDYELKYGYICITFGLLSVTMSYVLFGDRVVYGVLALAVVDTVSSITTMYTRGRRKVIKHSDVSITIAFTIFTAIVYLFTWDILKSVIISTVATITELVSPEDNLTLPITTSLTAYVINAKVPVL